MPVVPVRPKPVLLRVDYDAGPMTISVDLEGMQPKPPTPSKEKIDAVHKCGHSVC